MEIAADQGRDPCPSARSGRCCRRLNTNRVCQQALNGRSTPHSGTFGASLCSVKECHMETLAWGYPYVEPMSAIGALFSAVPIED